MSPDRCLVMGILNRTPDSFYDGGRTGLEESVAHALRLVEQGADILDVGGVKAGPGPEVSEDEELARVIPLIEAVREETDVTLSVETARPAVATAAAAAGAGILNDVTALADPELPSACAQAGVDLVLMHHGGQIRGRPRSPVYADVVADVARMWRESEALAAEQGVPSERLIFDPGLDFGKNTFHSLELMRRLPELTSQRDRVLIAPSRKDVVGETLALPLEERLEGTLALVALSVLHGAAIVRVHDVEATVRVVRMVEAVEGRRRPEAPVRGLWE
ncbi:MAG: dihydropteroate synthase [Actinomycetota bacterium]|nr:dihydropteroate synthase [Actinomycetota bacterium]